MLGFEGQRNIVRSKKVVPRRSGMEIGRCGGLTVWLALDFGQDLPVFYSVEVRAADLRLLWEANVGVDEEEARIRARGIHSLLYTAGEHWSREVQKLDLVQRGR